MSAAKGAYWSLTARWSCAVDDDLIHAVTLRQTVALCGADVVPLAFLHPTSSGGTARLVAAWPPYADGCEGRRRCPECWAKTGKQPIHHEFRAMREADA